MTDQVVSKNIGALITVRNGSTDNSVTAGGTGNNTTKTGIAIDRESIGSATGIPLSMLAAVTFDATLASGSTMSVAITVSDSADDSIFAAYSTESAVTVATGPSGGGVVSGISVLAVNLSSARRYIRVDHVPVMSRAGTDTAVTRSVAVLGGFDRIPSPA